MEAVEKNPKRNRLVYIENDFFDIISKMFRKRGWIVTKNILEADLVQFTGGPDVSPSLYNHPMHPQTITSVDRDRREVLIYKIALKAGIPMAGICRGAQFLNVMNGGALWQHIAEGKHSKPHDAIDLLTKETITVSSTHHQMMVPVSNKNLYSVLMTANLNCIKEKMTRGGTIISVTGSKEDLEAILYYETCCLCFQPHPEYEFFEPCREKYFSYLEHIM